MKIDENTKIIGRFAAGVSPRGLNIYNPLFEELGINALYILFHNPEPKVLMQGLRDLNLAGAVTVGFETDPRMKDLVDEFDDMSIYLGKVGFVKNINGVVKASYQGGEGMFRTIRQVSSISEKKLVIVGAGHVARSLLHFISKNGETPCEVEIYNRTLQNAESLMAEHNFIKKASVLDELKNSEGDVLVNLSHLGGREKDDLFTKEIVNNFNSVVDVTFENENTNLINLAKLASKRHATGWDMFTYQGQIALETILEQEIPGNILKKHVVLGLSEVVK